MAFNKINYRMKLEVRRSFSADRCNWLKSHWNL